MGYLSKLRRSINLFGRLFRLIFCNSFTKKRWISRESTDALRYLSNIEGPGSEFLLNYFDLSLVKNFLEIGSNCGNRLFALANRYPNTQFVGVDINLEAINVGREYIKKHNIKNVTLLKYDITSKEFNSYLKKEYFHIIFTWATLIYLHPRELRRLLPNIVESSARLVFLEQYFDSRKIKIVSSIPTRSGLQWKHDYLSKCKSLTSEKIEFTTCLSPIDLSIWDPMDGNGAVIDIKKDSKSTGG